MFGNAPGLQPAREEKPDWNHFQCNKNINKSHLISQGVGDNCTISIYCEQYLLSVLILFVYINPIRIYFCMHTILCAHYVMQVCSFKFIFRGDSAPTGCNWATGC